MSSWYWDTGGIYRCVKCNEPFSPGHIAREHPTTTNHQPLRLQKMNGKKLETGMEMLYSCQQSDPPELGNLLR